MKHEQLTHSHQNNLISLLTAISLCHFCHSNERENFINHKHAHSFILIRSISSLQLELGLFHVNPFILLSQTQNQRGEMIIL